MEAAVTKLICGKNGSICFNELEAIFPHDNYPAESLLEVTSNREKFHLAYLDGKRVVIAKTKLKLCKAKDCPGCRNLHLCKQFLFGDCRFEKQSQKACQFGHDIASGQNARILREHGLEELDRAELCTLLLQNDSCILPSVCHSYNNGVGEHGKCPDGDGCKRLHICERYLRGSCSCSHHAHDFYEPHPMRTLQDSGVPADMLGSIRDVYMNVEALREAERRGNRHERCPFFLKGSCKYGDRCFKIHSSHPNTQGRHGRWQSNFGSDDSTEQERGSSSTRCVPVALQPLHQRVQPPAAAGADAMEKGPEQLRQRNAETEPTAASEVETMKGQRIFEELREARRKLQEGEMVKKNLLDRYRDTKQIVVSLREQLEEKQRDNDGLKLQLDSMEARTQLKTRQKLTDCDPPPDDRSQLGEEWDSREEVVNDLRTRLASAELALVAKQQEVDALKQEAEVYKSDFYDERAAREKLHQEKEILAAKLEFVIKKNAQLQEAMDRQSLVEMRQRHSPRGAEAAKGLTGGHSRIPEHKEKIPEHACPKCEEILPDLDSLQIHIFDCIP